MRLDSHQHFWNYNPTEHVWMRDDMGILKRDYLPDDLKPLLESAGFEGCVSVQARQNLDETRWLLELAGRYDFIKGVVGWVDLRSEELAEQMAEFSKDPKLVGVRHVIHDELDDAFMLGESFRRGIGQLRGFGLTYDLLLFPRHLPGAAQLMEEFPEQPFVLDHIGKPAIRDGDLSPWREDLRALARYPRAYCKLSGMVTEAAWNAWRPEDFHRYLDCVIEAFGPDRVMIGSDWPVCLLSGDYRATMDIVIEYTRQFSTEAQEGILGENCARFYGLQMV